MTLVALSLALSIAAPSGYRERYPLPGAAFGQGWGVNIHFTHPRPGEMERMRDAGFKWVRMDFVWSRIESVKGRYDFASYDELMTALDGIGARPIFILDYGNDLYQEDSPRSAEARVGFCRFVEAAMKHFGGRGIVWEMWNEPNIPFWKPKPNVDEYIALAEEVGKTIRRVAPEEYYVGPASSGFDWTFLDACFKAGLLKYWDAVSVHPYRGSAPETVGLDWARLAASIDRYKPKGKSIPMISGEWGYSDVNLKGGLEQQARYAVRQYLANLQSGVDLSIWYDWKNDGFDPKEPEHHFGIQSEDLKSKPAFEAIATLSRALDGFKVLGSAFDTGDPNAEELFLSTGDKVATVKWGRGVDEVPKVEFGDAASGAYRDAVSRPWLPPIMLYESKYDLAGQLERFKGPRSTDWSLFAAVDGRPLGKGHVGEQGDFRFDPIQAHDSRPLLLGLRRKDGVGQRTLALCTKPILLRFVSSKPEAPRILVSNPGGLSWEGLLSVKGSAQAATVRLTLKPDETSKLVELPAKKGGYGDGWTVTLVKPASDRGIPLDSYGPIAATPVWEKPSVETSDWVADGDGAVTASLARTVVPVPPGAGFEEGFRLDYKFGSGWKFACLKPKGLAKPLPGKPSSLGFWLYGDGQGQILRMRFMDSTGQVFQPDYGTIDWKGWRFVDFSLDRSVSSHWGGANDGTIHWPIRIETALLLDSAARQSCQGTLYATGFMVFGPGQ